MTAAIRLPQAPSPIRISALSLAIALNLAFLLALSLMHVQVPDAPAAKEPMRIEFVSLARDPLLMPPPPPEMPKAPARPVSIPTPQPVAQPIPSPVEPIRTVVAEPTPLSEPFDAPETTPAPVASGDVGIAPVQLAILESPRPPYPMREIRLNHEGEVLLRLRIGTDGRPVAVDVERSSGYPELDRSAARHVLKKWRFAPPGGQGDVVGLLPVRFSLQ
jgi:protein TonB